MPEEVTRRVAVARLEGYTGPLCRDCGGKLQKYWVDTRWYCDTCGAVVDELEVAFNAITDAQT